MCEAPQPTIRGVLSQLWSSRMVFRKETPREDESRAERLHAQTTMIVVRDKPACVHHPPCFLHWISAYRFACATLMLEEIDREFATALVHPSTLRCVENRLCSLLPRLRSKILSSTTTEYYCDCDQSPTPVITLTRLSIRRATELR